MRCFLCLALLPLLHYSVFAENRPTVVEAGLQVNTPVPKWVEPLFEKFVKEGIPYADYHGLSLVQRPPSGYEVAVSAHYQTEQLYEDAQKVFSNRLSVDTDSAQYSRMMKLHRYAPEVRLMLSTFSRELRSIGVDMAEAYSHLEAAESLIRRFEKSFTDVPKNHWASTATRELKTLGILNGYPDGKFHG